MKKKGFTLIELIATVVILGVVFTIVSVLMLNVIRNVKIKSYQRSIDSYGRIVETSMAEYQSQNLKYPDKFEDLTIEYTGSKVECNISRINPDHTIYLSECKVNNKLVSNYHYGNLVLTDEEYVDTLGKNIEAALKDYHNQHNKYPVNYRLLDLPELDKDVNCVSEIHQDGTVYLTKCSIEGKYILNEKEEDGYYHYGKEIPIATKYLLKKTNGIEITNYTDGNIHEMYTFDHEATEQTPALTDYRFIGNVPKNYVKFNGDETWRIIGVFSVDDGTGNYEERVKLIRDDTLVNNKWNASNSNEWVGSTIQLYINNTYTLDDESNEMINPSKYYLGGRGNPANGEVLYKSERSEAVATADRSKYWTGNVALMYPSDYIFTYALGIDDICYNTPDSCNNSNPLSGWLYRSGYSQWTMTPFSSYSTGVFLVYSNGKVFSHGLGTTGSYGDSPVLS